MRTAQLAPRVATVPTHKVLKFFNKEFATLLNQSFFWQCEKFAEDNEIALRFRNSDVVISLVIEPAEMSEYMEGGVA